MALLAAGRDLFGGPNSGVNRHIGLGYVCGWKSHFQGPLTGVFRLLLATSIGSKDGEHTVSRLPLPSGSQSEFICKGKACYLFSLTDLDRLRHQLCVLRTKDSEWLLHS